MRHLPHPVAAQTARVLVLLLLGLGALALPARGEDAPALPHPLARLHFLVGRFEGEGRFPGGMTYQERLTGTWILGDTALEIRSESTVQGSTVFEDRRILSYDAATKSIRMRQWAAGWMRTYTCKDAADPTAPGALVFEQTAHEGKAEDTWRYTFAPKDGGGFAYTVHTVEGATAKPFVSGSLGVPMKDPAQAGGLGLKQYDAEIAGMQAQVHHPDGEGPYPLLVFSPGGGAETCEGYRPYGRWFATWGYVTVIVAFNDQDADERAGKFGTVIDWALAEHAREGSPLRGLLDPERVAAVGHSRGGFAALVAGAKDERIDAVLALAPSGPSEGSADAHGPAACVIVGSGDQFRGAAQKACALQRGERFYVEIEGLEHMLTPREAVLKLVRRSTCFLEYALKGDARYREPLLAAEDGVAVQQSKLGTK